MTRAVRGMNMVDRVDINSVLMQMRQVKSQLRAQNMQQANMAEAVKPAQSTPSALDKIRAARLESQVQAVQDTPKGDNSIPNFSNMFKNAIDSVNTQQKISSDLATRFEQGDASVDLPEVMIAMQKSSVSFQAMTQVRNKLVEAYKDIMNMPV